MTTCGWSAATGSARAGRWAIPRLPRSPPRNDRRDRAENGIKNGGPGMRAIGLIEFGGPEVLRVIDLPDPVPGPGEVRIRVHTAAVNPTDTMLRAGVVKAWFQGRPGPYVPGMDAAGVVDAIGPDTDTSLRLGDRVIAILQAYAPRGGAYAELVVAPVESVVSMPPGVDFPAACTLLMNALTARLALDFVAVPAGGTVAVTGAV